MADPVRMQAKSSSSGLLYIWTSPSGPDFAGAGFPGPGGTAIDIARASPPSPGPAVVAPTDHGTAFSPTALFQLHENLTESVNAIALSTTAGAVLYTEIYPTVRALYVTPTLQLKDTTPGGPLQITGDITIEMLIKLTSLPTSGNARICSYSGSSGRPASNNVWQLDITAGGAPRWVQDISTGSTAVYIPTGVSMPFDLCHFAVTRTSDVIQFYLNGLPFGAASGTLATATGGTASTFHIGNIEGIVSQALECALGSLKIVATARSAAEIKAEYNRCLGSVYGLAS